MQLKLGPIPIVEVDHEVAPGVISTQTHILFILLPVAFPFLFRGTATVS